VPKADPTSLLCFITKFGNLNILEPSGLLRASDGTALAYIYIYIYIYVCVCLCVCVCVCVYIKYICLQMSCHPVAVVIMHVYKYEIKIT